MSENLLKPRTTKPRSATTNNQVNGNIVNPPTYPEIGGMKSGAWKKGRVATAMPGPGKKII